MIINSYDAEKEATLSVAKQMAIGARTAPKACGDDSIETVILTGDEKNILTKEMLSIGEELGQDFFIRDAHNIDNSHCILLIGVKDVKLGLEGCGFCGLENCGKNKSAGAICALKITDLGISVGSAVSIAADNRIDNRIMYSAGKAAMRLSLFDEKVAIAYGIPLATLGKSLFYDRAEQSGVLITAKK